jgi:hypothetical protein
MKEMDGIGIASDSGIYIYICTDKTMKAQF